MDSLNKIIKFNVRGVKFKLHQKYIEKVQDSTFAQDFSESNNIFQDENGLFCIDHYPEAFGLLIKYIETDNYVPAEESEKEILEFELEFWGMKKKNNIVSQKDKHLNMKIQENIRKKLVEQRNDEEEAPVVQEFEKNQLCEKLNETLNSVPNLSSEIWNNLGPISIEFIAENTPVPINFDLNFYELKEQNKNGNPETFKKGQFSKDQNQFQGIVRFQESKKDEQGIEVSSLIYEGQYEKGYDGFGRLIMYENGLLKECYQGQWKQNRKNGMGTLFNSEGLIIYKGQFEFDQCKGFGLRSYEDGSKYVGQFKDLKKNGFGTEYYSNGKIRYQGQYKDDEYNGQGKKIYENGDYYIGLWNGLNDNFLYQHGFGTLYNQKGKIIYQGIWENFQHQIDEECKIQDQEYLIYDEESGFAKLFNPDKSLRYQGQMTNQNFNGIGKYIHNNGNYYIGKWMNGKKHGEGKLYHFGGDLYFKGKFINDKKEGEGIEYYSNGKIKYQGSFQNDSYNGNGTIFWRNGDYFTGVFKDGLAVKEGILYCQDNKVKYKGEIQSSHRNGHGEYFWPDGSYYVGEWLNGKMHGKGNIIEKQQKAQKIIDF